MSDGKIPKDSLIGNLKSRYKWRKVERPQTWRPKNEGEELIGFYGGKTSRAGRYGQYDVVLVHVPNEGSFLISGTQAIQAFDTAQVSVGWPVRVVWGGLQELDKVDEATGEKRKMKRVEVFVAEGEPVPVEFLPRVEGVSAGETPH